MLQAERSVGPLMERFYVARIRWGQLVSFLFFLVKMATENFPNASDSKRRRFADVVDVPEGDDVYPHSAQLDPESSSQSPENDSLLDEDSSCISLREEAQKLQDMEHDLFLSKALDMNFSFLNYEYVSVQ